MALAPTAAWLREVVSGKPVFSVQIDINGSTAFKFLSSDESSLSSTRNGAWHPLASNFAPVSGSIDPITRVFSQSQIHFDLADTGTGSFVRNMLVNNRVRGKRAIIKLGWAGLTSHSDFLPYATGFIQDYVGDDGVVTVKMRDPFWRLEQDKEITAAWTNKHPLEIIEDVMLNQSGIPSALVDATSLDPDTYSANISHFAAFRQEVNYANNADGVITESAREIVNELSAQLYGGLVPQEDGQLTFFQYDSSAAAAANLTEDDILEIETLETTESVVNEVIAKWMWRYQLGTTVFTTIHGNQTSQTNYAYPGESEQTFSPWEQEFKWNNAEATAEAITDSTLTVILHGANLDSFSGMRNSGTHWAASASRPVYLLLKSTNPYTGDTAEEVVEVTSITLDGTITNERGNPAKATCTISASGRDILGGGSATGFAIPACGVWDVTPVISWARKAIQRLSEGLPRVRIKTGLNLFKLQLGDLITLTTTRFVAFGFDGLTSSTKWEVIEKEADAEDSPGCRYTLALATNVTGYTEEWSNTAGVRFGVYNDGLVIDTGPFRDALVNAGAQASINSGLDLDIGKGSVAGGSHNRTLPAIDGLTMTASKDIYATWDSVGKGYVFTDVANGAAAPTLQKGHVPIAKIVTDGSSITSVTDMRKMASTDARPSLFAGPRGGMNLDFAESLDSVYVPPLGWRMAAETWNTDVTLSTTVLRSGRQSLHFKNTTPSSDPKIYSEPVRVDQSEWYQFKTWVRADSIAAGKTVTAQIQFLKKDGYTSAGSIQTVHNAVLNAANTWEQKILVVRPVDVSSDAYYYRWEFSKDNTAFNVYVDEAEMTPWRAIAQFKISSDQNVTKAGTTQVALNTAPIDPGSWTGSNVVTIKRDGRYRITGQNEFRACSDATTTGMIQTHVVAGGNTYKLSRHALGDNANNNFIQNGTVSVDLNVGDTVGLFGDVDTDTDWYFDADNTWLEVEWIGPIGT